MDRRQGPRPRPRPEEARGKSEVDDRPAWLRLLDEAEGPNCVRAVADRVEELLWVLDHQEDLDADFLAIYHIDLDEDEITARRYFALAHRLTAYSGVMAARAEAEREEQQPAPSSTPTRTSSTPAPSRAESSEVREVSLMAFRMQFPGLVSMGGGADGG